MGAGQPHASHLPGRHHHHDLRVALLNRAQLSRQLRHGADDPAETDPSRPGAGGTAEPATPGVNGFITVQAVATHFGFSSRNHFARDYRQLFGEAPSETLQRSATPGIRSHPVSVAHRPQMAMARR
ncbi:MAG: AraC family transcriptional regulator [Synechococcus sp. YX04-3]|nr:MAG: AraC family transcriptional regulator [Synechococcus sp. YX04-3]